MQTLSNPSNKVRGIYFVKEVFTRPLSLWIILHVYACVYAYENITYAYIYIYIYICVCLFVCIYMYIYVCITVDAYDSCFSLVNRHRISMFQKSFCILIIIIIIIKSSCTHGFTWLSRSFSLSLHPSLSSVALGRSSTLYPVYAQSYCR